MTNSELRIIALEYKHSRREAIAANANESTDPMIKVRLMGWYGAISLLVSQLGIEEKVKEVLE